ncbi:MAG: hypothetical protein V2I33_21780 [Kangiellaceae bacterium]|jgi:hypothetical protein|nr:hypothetical protein [Kangiellaceae bacterium]
MSFDLLPTIDTESRLTRPANIVVPEEEFPVHPVLFDKQKAADPPVLILQ